MPTARRAGHRLRDRARRTGIRRSGGRVGPRTHGAWGRADRDADAGGDAVDRDAAGGGPRDAFGARFDAGAAFGRRTGRRDRAATAGRRLWTGNSLCRRGIRHPTTGDRRPVRAVRSGRAGEGSRRYPYRRHRGRGCACRRRIFRQLPLLLGAGTPRAALMRVLLLGGTAEARALAAQLDPDVDVISSLAGRVPNPALPVGEVRIGGFGGVDGMRRWLGDSKVDAVVDATHPYAATITAHAAAVCDELALPHVVLARPAWPPGDAIVVGSDVEAAKTVAVERYSRVFLTTGRSGTAAFADVDAWFLIRAVSAPDADTLPRRHQLVLSRGPYHYDHEVALLREHRIDALVTKNSGGRMTRPKLDAAAALGVAVMMVDRPPLPPGVTTVST